MSLDWSIDGIANWRKVCHVPNEAGTGITLSPITNALIWNCMFIGIGEITEKNWLEWWMRYETLGAMMDEPETFCWTEDGAWVMGPSGKPARRRLRASDVKAHVGLRTNVFPKWTKTRFYDRLMQAAADHANVPRAEQPPVIVSKKRR